MLHVCKSLHWCLFKSDELTCHDHRQPIDIVSIIGCNYIFIVFANNLFNLQTALFSWQIPFSFHHKLVSSDSSWWVKQPVEGIPSNGLLFITTLLWLRDRMAAKTLQPAYHSQTQTWQVSNEHLNLLRLVHGADLRVGETNMVDLEGRGNPQKHIYKLRVRRYVRWAKLDHMGENAPCLIRDSYPLSVCHNITMPCQMSLRNHTLKLVANHNGLRLGK